MWPVKWHSDVLITGTQETSELEVEVIDTGKFYYTWDTPNDRGTTAMLMSNISTGEVTRDVNLYGTFYYINDTSHSCFHFKVPGVNGPTSPTWLKSFSFNETQYLSKHEGKADSHWLSAGHWQFDSFGGGPNHLFNYWHSDDDAEIPSRIMGPSFTKAPYGHSFIEIDNYHVGFDDVPDVDALFKVPANCAGPLDPLELARAAKTGDTSGLLASESDAALSEADQHHLKSLVDRVAQAGHLSPLVLLSERCTTSITSFKVRRKSRLSSRTLCPEEEPDLRGSCNGMAAWRAMIQGKERTATPCGPQFHANPPEMEYF